MSDMSEEDRLLMLFKLVHGELSSNFHLKVCHDDYEEMAIEVIKNGNLCWRATKTDLLFDFITDKIAAKQAKKAAKPECECRGEWDDAGHDPMTGDKFKRCCDCGKVSIR